MIADRRFNLKMTALLLSWVMSTKNYLIVHPPDHLTSSQVRKSNPIGSFLEVATKTGYSDMKNIYWKTRKLLKKSIQILHYCIKTEKNLWRCPWYKRVKEDVWRRIHLHSILKTSLPQKEEWNTHPKLWKRMLIEKEALIAT